VSSPSRIARTWSSRTTAAWRSTLSWMRWRRRRELRRSQERELLLEQMALLLEPLLRQQMLLLAQPLSEALSRQDSLLLQQTEPLSEMLLELLAAQPTPASRMRQELGIPSRT
jgi:hypothetical protein